MSESDCAQIREKHGLVFVWIDTYLDIGERESEREKKIIDAALFWHILIRKRPLQTYRPK